MLLLAGMMSLRMLRVVVIVADLNNDMKPNLIKSGDDVNKLLEKDREIIPNLLKID